MRLKTTAASRSVVVVVLDLDADALVPRQVGAVERVGRERRLIERDEPVGMFDHPAGIDAHVVGTMSLARRMPRCRARVLQVLKRRFAAQVVGDGDNRYSE